MLNERPTARDWATMAPDGVALDGADSLAVELFWSCPLVRIFVPTGKDLRVMLANEGDRFIRNAIECSRVFSYDEATKA